MNSLNQGDLDQDFNIDTTGAVVETRTVIAPLDGVGAKPNLVYAIDDPLAVQIIGTNQQYGTRGERVKWSTKYNRCVVFVLVASNKIVRARRTANQNTGTIYYRVWEPDGDDPVGVGKSWHDWNSRSDKDNSKKPLTTTPVIKGSLTVSSVKSKKWHIVITGTLAADGTDHSWTGTWNPPTKSRAEYIDWTDAP